MPELAAKLEDARGVTVHPASLSRFLIAHGFSVKKNTAGKRDRSQ
jgi:transposase